MIVALIIVFNYATSLRCHKRKNSIKHESEYINVFIFTSAQNGLLRHLHQQIVRGYEEYFMTFSIDMYSSFSLCYDMVTMTLSISNDQVQDANEVEGCIQSIKIVYLTLKSSSIRKQAKRRRNQTGTTRGGFCIL